MELRHFRYFMAVAEYGSFTKAAERLFVSQPTLSQQIRDLERELGVTLFRRERDGTRVTVAGEVFYDRAKRVFAAVEDSIADTRRAASTMSTLRIGVAGPLPESVHVPVVSAFTAAFPQVQIRMHELGFPTYEQPLIDGQVDVALLRAPMDLDRLVCLPVVAGEPSALLTPMGHPFWDADAVDLRDFLAEPLPRISRELSERSRAFWMYYKERNDEYPRLVGHDAATAADMVLSAGLHGVVVPAPIEAVRGVMVARFKAVELCGGHLSTTYAVRRRDDRRALTETFCELAAQIGAEVVDADRWRR
jgi:DNA-binding transcriptional LysR family regulator